MTDAAQMPHAARARLEDVLARIAAAARGVGRDPATVKLVAVSKTFPAEAVVPVLEAGQRVFGENRVQEAKAKWPALRERFGRVGADPGAAGNDGIELHLIGPLQTNKAHEAVALFDVIHTIDRERIARAIAAEMAKQGRRLKLLVEVNTGEEPQKAGIMPREAGAFVAFCRGELKLDIAGLMCIPPVDEEPAVHFAFLSKLAKELGLTELSMGMSADFETAVELGATMVRVGSAIFGHRN